MGTRNRDKEASISHEWLRGSDGYRAVTINGDAFLAPNLIWFLVTGEWPASSIDHVNRDRGDDRWTNLRPATQTQNNFNQKVRIDNALGIRGVSYCQTRNRYVANLVVKGRHVLHQRFKTESEAAMARRQAELLYCGEFSPQERTGVAA